MKTALAHDWLTVRAGSEIQIEALGELFPQAPIHTLVHDKEQYRGPLNAHTIVPSFINRLPFAKTKYKHFLPLFPMAVEQFDFTEFDLVLSSCHAAVKGLLTSVDQLHMCYCYTPTRYIWDLYQPYLRSAGLDKGAKSALARYILHRYRLWDITASNRVDGFVAISHYIARRIAKTYRRPAHVIYPGVDVERFTPNDKRDDFYLAVSRLVPYKGMDLIAKACTQLDRPLVIIGDGPQRDIVEQSAGPNVKLLGYQPDSVVENYMQRCKAFIFAADEDFGMVPVEAQATGAPVIAFGKGGALETVARGKTGIFFKEQTAASLCLAIKQFESQAEQFHFDTIVKHASQFSIARFKREMMQLIDQSWSRFNKGESVEPH